MPKLKKPKYNKKIADQLFSELIRKAGKCFKCGSTFHLQTAHIFTRGYYTIRWNPRNAKCLCAKCHMYFTYHPIEWENFIKYHIGEEEYNDLRRMALAYEKIDYQAIIEGLIGQLTLIT